MPALRASPTPLPTGIAIDGDLLTLANDHGSVVLDDQTWQLAPFEVVDCTDCPGGPWLEIHSLLTAPVEACYAILYLYPDQRDQAQLAYGICLPSLATHAANFDVTWTGTLSPSPLSRVTPPALRAGWPPLPGPGRPPPR